MEHKPEEDKKHDETKDQEKTEEKEAKKGGKEDREKKKKERLDARQKKATEQQPEEQYKIDPNDPCIGKFGDRELNRSQSNPDERYQVKFTAVKDLDDALKDQEVFVRGRLHQSRAKGKTCFIVVREQFATVQAAMFVGDTVSKGMIEYARRIPKESIIDIKAKVSVPN